MAGNTFLKAIPRAPTTSGESPVKWLHWSSAAEQTGKWGHIGVVEADSFHAYGDVLRRIPGQVTLFSFHFLS